MKNYYDITPQQRKLKLAWSIQAAEDIRAMNPMISQYNCDLIHKMLHDPEFDPLPFMEEALTFLLDHVDHNELHPLSVAANEYRKRHNVPNLQKRGPRFLPGKSSPNSRT